MFLFFCWFSQSSYFIETSASAKAHAVDDMSGSGKGLLGLWLYRSGEQEWAVKEGSPLHKRKELMVRKTVSLLFWPIWSAFGNLILQAPDTSKQPPAEAVTPGDKTSIIFTLNNQVGGLARALQVFQELGINVLHLELQNTNPSVEQVRHTNIGDYFLGEFYIYWIWHRRTSSWTSNAIRSIWRK